MGFTPIDIENQKFDVRMRGYDRAQVKSFLVAIAEDSAREVGERNLLEERADELQRQIEESQKREKRVQETILALRELTEKMKEDARREADLIVREARLKADQILEDARTEALRIEGDISTLRLERDAFEDRLRLLIDEHQRLLIQRRQELDYAGPIQFRKRRVGEAEQ